MDESPTSAEEFFKKANELKAKGHTQAALTEYRRAVLADPNHMMSHLEIGYICKKLANNDTMYLSYAYDAFKNAARLDMTHEEAHNQYIILGQLNGRLDRVREQYQEWTKAQPDNELLSRQLKNVETLIIALVPDPVRMSEAKGSPTLLKMTLFGSIGGMIFGLILMLMPIFIKKNTQVNVEHNHLKNLVLTGFVVELMSLAGLAVYSQIK